jgi:hypothetical protein
MHVHALHVVRALPDLRVAGGRLGDGVSLLIEQPVAVLSVDYSLSVPTNAHRSAATTFILLPVIVAKLSNQHLLDQIPVDI